jgi:hypothetical protein
MAFKDDCMFYLNEALNEFLRDFDLKFEIIDEDTNWTENEYFARIKINNKTFDFIINETMNEYDIPCNLVFRRGTNNYIGATNIFIKIINIIYCDLVFHEINEIEKQLAKEEEFIKFLDFQIKGASSLMSKFSLPAEIALLCF